MQHSYKTLATFTPDYIKCKEFYTFQEKKIKKKITHLIKDVCLQGLANMILSGLTPISNTCLISFLLAQSKLAPSFASNDETTGSGLHLMAK